MPIEILGVSHVYMPGTPFETTALDDVSLTIKDGETVGIIGHTGSGKSTLVQHLNGLVKPTRGRVLVDGIDTSVKGVDLRAVRRKVGLVFQYPEYQLFEETVEKDIAFGLAGENLSLKETARRVKEAALMTGLPEDALWKSPFDLSGGQKRRAAIAGVLAMRPKALVLDEPAAGLDPEGRAEILNLIRRIHEETGGAIVMVTHSMADAAALCDRVVVMNQGRVELDGTPAEVFSRKDELTRIGLDLPPCAELANRLRKKGMGIPSGALAVSALADAICAHFAEGGEPSV